MPCIVFDVSSTHDLTNRGEERDRERDEEGSFAYLLPFEGATLV